MGCEGWLNDGNGTVDCFGGSETFGAAEGMVSEGKSVVEGLAGAGAVAALSVDGVGLPNEKAEAAVKGAEGAGAGVAAAAGLESAATVDGGTIARPTVGVDVLGFFSGSGAASCLTFSLSLAIAAASRSCFSHFEYDFDGLSFGLSGMELMLWTVDMRRTGATCDCENGLMRMLPVETRDCFGVVLLGAKISFCDVDAHKRFLPFDGDSWRTL